MIEFYDTLNEDTALEWYALCPTHLRKKIDEEVMKARTGEEALCTDNEALWERVSNELDCTRPRKLPPEEHLGDGYSSAELAQYAKRKAWVKRYDELIKISTVLKLAPSIQNERKLLSKAFGGAGGELPQQYAMDGIDDVQAATIRWLQATGITPLESLAEIYRSNDPDVRVSDRIAAASKLMEYVHKKVPVKQEIKQDPAATPEISPDSFSKLNSKELTLLKELMRKMREGQDEQD